MGSMDMGLVAPPEFEQLVFPEVEHAANSQFVDREKLVLAGVMGESRMYLQRHLDTFPRGLRAAILQREERKAQRSQIAISVRMIDAVSRLVESVTSVGSGESNVNTYLIARDLNFRMFEEQGLGRMYDKAEMVLLEE